MGMGMKIKTYGPVFWTSLNPSLFWCEQKGTRVLAHNHIIWFLDLGDVFHNVFFCIVVGPVPFLDWNHLQHCNQSMKDRKVGLADWLRVSTNCCFDGDFICNYIYIYIYTYTQIPRQKYTDRCIFSIFFDALPGCKNCNFIGSSEVRCEQSHEQSLPCHMGKTRKLPDCSSDNI